ncbi:hypothetical protein Tco_1281568, partial [Tanacetum coccineum]
DTLLWRNHDGVMHDFSVRKVWNIIRERGEEIEWFRMMIPRSPRNNVTCIVGRLVLATSSYFVWQERNNRIHGKCERNPENVTSIVIDMVKLKLASIRFKKNARVDRMKSIWKLAIEE